MTTIKTETTSYELDYDCDELINQTTDYAKDEDGNWRMDDDEAEWWAEFAARQEAIEDAIEDADEATADEARAAYENADIEMAQREACAILGIAKPFEMYELEAFIGNENIDDYDIAAIIEDATEIDYITGNRVWRYGINLDAICEKHAK